MRQTKKCMCAKKNACAERKNVCTVRKNVCALRKISYGTYIFSFGTYIFLSAHTYFIWHIHILIQKLMFFVWHIHQTTSKQLPNKGSACNTCYAWFDFDRWMGNQWCREFNFSQLPLLFGFTCWFLSNSAFRLLVLDCFHWTLWTRLCYFVFGRHFQV